MAKEYQVTGSVRFVNRLMGFTSRRGWGHQELLTTNGRTSGALREVPVSPIAVDGVEYLVSPYGDVGWVRNVRADPRATLRKGGEIRSIVLHEVSGTVPEVVHSYYQKEPFARPYMDVPAEPTVADFEEVGTAFPVFRVETA